MSSGSKVYPSISGGAIEIGTHLHDRVRYNDSYGVTILLQHHPNIDIEQPDENGNTPLLLAASQGQPECVRILLGAGAKYKQINIFGQNALTLATRAGCQKCIDMLLAKWSYSDYTKATLTPPLCVAVLYNNLKLVKFFSRLFPGPEHVKTAHGANAVALAEALDHRAILQFLVSKYPNMRPESP